MSSPNDRHYTSHGEWAKPDTQNVGTYLVGITARRASELGTITSQNFNCQNGTSVNTSQAVCTLNNSSGGEVPSPLVGIVRNERLFDTPGNIGTDPWNSNLFSIQASNPSDYNSLLTAAQYDALPGS